MDFDDNGLWDIAKGFAYSILFLALTAIIYGFIDMVERM